MRKSERTTLVGWLRHQIEEANKAIVSARESQNYGKEVQLSGMKAAYERTLEQVAGV